MKLLLTLVLSLFAFRVVSAVPATQILVVHSYSQHYPWTNRQDNGFMEVLAGDARLKASVTTEYLDTKRRAYDGTYAKEMARFFGMKYAGYQPAAIYVTDDDALLFALDHLSGIFPGTPVFFSGVNDYGALKTLDPSLATGVFELKEVVPNIDWLRAFDKNANDLVFLGDGSSTYLAIEREARKALAPSGLRATFVAGKKFGPAMDRLRDLPGKYVILATVGGMADENGHVLPLPEIVKGIVRTGRTIISMEDSYVMEGVLGGWVTSGQEQGKAAARLLLAYLHGKPVADLPPILKSPNAMLFDDAALQKRGIQLPGNLRDQAVLLNPRPDFYEKQHLLIVGSLFGLSGALFLAVTGGIVVLSRRNRQLHLARQRAESTLLENLARAEELSRLKSRFVSMASHELKTPLANVMLASELLKDFGAVMPADRSQAVLDGLVSSVASMVQTLDALLFAGKIEDGKMAFTPARFNLLGFLRRCGMEVRKSGEPASRIEVVFQDAGLDVVADERLLQHILRNLLENALKYSPADSTIEVRADCPGHDLLSISVRDRGIGVPEPDRKFLFDAFSRATNVGDKPGSGLGLFIAQKCAQTHGGLLQYFPQKNGSLFSLTVPLSPLPVNAN